MEQPAVSPVDHDHVKSTPLGSEGSISVLVRQFLQLLSGQAPDRIPVLVYRVAGTYRLSCLQEHRICQLSAVVQLDGCQRPMGVDGVDHLGQAGERVICIQPYHVGMGLSPCCVHQAVPYDDHRAAAHGFELIVGDVALIQVFVWPQLGQRSRR